MNKTLNVYTELDSVYDSRRGILQHLMVPEGKDPDEVRKAKADNLWDMHIADNYKKRTMDRFEHPLFGINKAKFEEAFAQRGLSHWMMYYPSNVMYRLLKNVLEMEGLEDKPISIKGIDLFVNVYPYPFDDQLKQSFISFCKTIFKGIVNVKVLDINPAEATAHFYKQFDYVFKYDVLMGKESKALMDSLKANPIPNTTFVVPDIEIKETEHFEGTVYDRLFALSIALAPAFKLIPARHNLYDYAEKA